MLTLLAILSTALAGAGADFIPGVEGQWGFGAPVVAPDGVHVAVTGWDRRGLWVLDVRDGSMRAVSADRGAGFAPIWQGDSLLFKSVPGGETGQAAWRWRAGDLERLDAGARVGQPAITASGGLIWTHGGELRELRGVSFVSSAGVGDVDLLAPNPATGALAWTDGSGLLHLQSAAPSELQVPPGAHPAWSSDGKLLVEAGYAGNLLVVDPMAGTVRVVEGSHPHWVEGTHTLFFDRIETGADGGPAEGQSPYSVVSSALWAYDADADQAALRFASDALHPRFPAPLPGGDLLFVDSVGGGLWRLHQGAASLVSPGPSPEGAPPPPPAFETNAVSVPYMHQLWDTPDDFDGGWSCGPTSCLQAVAKWGNFPTADITTSWPYAHTSHWGWYVPNNYNYLGYQYDVWGVAKSSDCQGAHGFICREYGGAIWSQISAFLNQHGVGSGQLGTSYDYVINEPNAGYPLVASTSVLGYGHILVIRGYLSSGGSPIHSIVVNDPYGNAGSGDWGNFDGEGAIYDWPGYDNGYLEIGVSQLFSAHGVAAVVETPPADDGSTGASDPPPAEDTTTAAADAGTTTPDDPPYAAAHRSPSPGMLTDLDDVTGCNHVSAPSGWAAVAALALLRRRR